MGPGDAPDNRPDEPACEKHGDAHMYDDGHVVECVECLLIDNRKLQTEIKKWKDLWFEDAKSRDDAINENAKLLLQVSELQSRLNKATDEAVKHRFDLGESNRLNGELKTRIEALEDGLRKGIASVKEWGDYAGEYFQDKWDLKGDIKELEIILTPEVKRVASSQMCLEQIGCLGAQCHKLMPCDDHPTKTCYSCPSCEHLNQIHNCQCHQ